uniref:Uncharacterized protein n=1 Tax=Aegilops tauschii subsp. strangulata TaxID=200361 RepID=A0A453NX60_AEGTS
IAYQPPAPAPQQQQPGIAWRLVTLPFYVVSGGVGLVTGSIRLGFWVASGVLSRSLSLLGLVQGGGPQPLHRDSRGQQLGPPACRLLHHRRPLLARAVHLCPA